MWSEAHSRDKAFWIEWLQQYKNFRCLWDTDAKDYTNRYKRKEAYAELAYLASTINPAADELFVRTRVNNFRTAFRKEEKKVIAAKKEGIPYTPKLFYYHVLNEFLGSADDIDDTFGDNAEQDDQGEEEENLDSDDEEDERDPFEDRKPSPSESLPKKRKQVTVNVPEPLAHNPNIVHNISKRARIENPIISHGEDECDLLGRRLATHFRSMKPQQRLIAEKIISDVCIYGRLEQLTLQTNLTIQMPTYTNEPEELQEEFIATDGNEEEAYETYAILEG